MGKSKRKIEMSEKKMSLKIIKRQVLHSGIITAIGISLHNFPKGIAVFLGSIKIEKTLHDMCAEYAEVKVASEIKYAEARTMVEDAQNSLIEAEEKIRTAESLESESSRYDRNAKRKFHEVQELKDDLRRRTMALKSDDIINNERMELLKAFDETEAGVKGLLDSGLTKIPKIFIRPPEELSQEHLHLTNKKKTQIQVPVIDLSDIQNPDKRKQVVEQVRVSSETWGFFQVRNHGIPLAVTDAMINGVKEFNEQDVETKKKYYTRDNTKSVRFNSNYDLFTSRTAGWRDTLSIAFPGTDQICLDELPTACRYSAMEYSKHVEILGNVLLGLLSEALGLKTDHLKNMETSKGHRLSCHYYPACAEPELSIGTAKHSDPGFVTILLQNQMISGLQVMYEGQWVDIQPTQEALVINIGDLLQLVSNGKFKSNEHRAISNGIGPRISVACFFSGPVMTAKIYGPIEELISEENPPIYREVILSEYIMKFLNTGLDNYRALDYYKL